MHIEKLAALASSKISRVYLDFRFGLLLEGDEIYEIAISNRFKFVYKDQVILCDPANPHSLRDLLVLFGKKVNSVEVSDSWDLKLNFENAQIEVTGSAMYEAWEISGPEFSLSCPLLS